MLFADELKEKTAKTLDARAEVIKAMRKRFAQTNSFGPEFQSHYMSLTELGALFVEHGLITREDRDLNAGMYHFNNALQTVVQYFEAEGIKVKMIFNGNINFVFEWGMEQ